MIDGVRTEIDDHVDMMVDRIVQPDGIAPVITQDAVKTTTLAPYAADICAPKTISRHRSSATRPRRTRFEWIDQTAEAGDADTA